ncbi:hypothetical protein J3F84DRAFT_121376 [Trichoderma pleuroticola]
MEIDDLLPRSDEDKFCRLPFAERLEKLKPIIVELYTGNYGPGGKRMMMRQVVEFMKDKYSFHIASVVHPPFQRKFCLPRYDSLLTLSNI